MFLLLIKNIPEFITISMKFANNIIPNSNIWILCTKGSICLSFFLILMGILFFIQNATILLIEKYTFSIMERIGFEIKEEKEVFMVWQEDLEELAKSVATAVVALNTPIFDNLVKTLETLILKFEKIEEALAAKSESASIPQSRQYPVTTPSNLQQQSNCIPNSIDVLHQAMQQLQLQNQINSLLLQRLQFQPINSIPSTILNSNSVLQTQQQQQPLNSTAHELKLGTISGQQAIIDTDLQLS